MKPAPASASAPITERAKEVEPPSPQGDNFEQEEANKIKHSEQVLTGLRSLLNGQLPDAPALTELFPIDLADERSVSVLLRELEADADRLGISRSRPVPSASALTNQPSSVGSSIASASSASAPSQPGTVTPSVPSIRDPSELRETIDGRDSVTFRSVYKTRLRNEILLAQIAVLRLPANLRRLLVDSSNQREGANKELVENEAEKERATKEILDAEASRRRALELADDSRLEEIRLIATEQARAEGVRRDQAQFRRTLAENRQKVRESQLRFSRRHQYFIEKIAAVETSSQAADTLFDECVNELSKAREELKLALEDVVGGKAIPMYVFPSKLSFTDPSAIQKKNELQSLASRLETSAEKLAGDLEALRRDSLQKAHTRERLLSDTRSDLFEKISSKRREQFLDLGPSGFAQLRNDFQRARLEIKWYTFERRALGTDLLALFQNPLLFASTMWAVFWICLTLFGATWLGRRGPAVLGRVGSLVTTNLRSSWFARPIVALLSGLQTLLADASLALAVTLLPWASGALWGGPELLLVYALLGRYAAYRVLLTVSFHSIKLFSRFDAETTRLYGDKIVSSLRIVGRWVLLLSSSLAVAAMLVGQGYLFYILRKLAWLGVLPISIVLIRAWRNDIVDTYLSLRANGAMPDAVRATRQRWYGFFVAIAALLALALIAAGRLITRTILDFEQVRRALAYVFRKRLEQAADSTGDTSDVSSLPPSLVHALSEDPIDNPAWIIPNVNTTESIEKSLAQWVEQPAVGAALILGDVGYGKSFSAAQVLRFAVKSSLETTTISFGYSITEPARLLAVLANALNAPPESSSTVEALSAWLNNQPKRVLLLDDAHMLIRRGIDDLNAWDCLVGLIENTGIQVFWLCTMARFPHEFLHWVRRGSNSFRVVLRLRPWTDSEIGELLRRRTKSVGYETRYDDLVVERLDGFDGDAQLLRTENEYARLIWDYSEGCPRSALRCWKGSLIPSDSGTLRVKLFRRPAAEKLDELTRRQRFLLASLVWHQRASADDLSNSLRQPIERCLSALAILSEWGVVEQKGGQYRVETAWLQPVRRLLRREHLIED